MFLFLCLAALVITPVLIVFFKASGLVNGIFVNMTVSGLMPASVLAQTQAVTANWTLLDQMVFFLIIGICFTALVLASFLNSSPLNFAYGFVMLIILTFVSFYVSNVAYSIVSESRAHLSIRQVPAHALDRRAVAGIRRIVHRSLSRGDSIAFLPRRPTLPPLVMVNEPPIISIPRALRARPTCRAGISERDLLFRQLSCRSQWGVATHFHKLRWNDRDRIHAASCPACEHNGGKLSDCQRHLRRYSRSAVD